MFVEHLSADKARVQMVLRDVTGRRVLQTEVPILRAGDRHQRNISGLVPGLYKLSITTGDYKKMMQIMIG